MAGKKDASPSLPNASELAGGPQQRPPQPGQWQQRRPQYNQRVETKTHGQLLPGCPSLSPAVRDTPVGGQLRLFAKEWDKTSASQEVKTIIRKGLTLCFAQDALQQKKKRQMLSFNKQQEAAIDQEVQEMIQKQAATITHTLEGLFLSEVFTRPKTDQGYQLILNLKPLDNFIKTKHFKMESLKTALHSLSLSSKTTGLSKRT